MIKDNFGPSLPKMPFAVATKVMRDEMNLNRPSEGVH